MATTEAGTVGTGIRLFEVDIPQAELDEPRRRVPATRRPEQETVADSTPGVRLAMPVTDVILEAPAAV